MRLGQTFDSYASMVGRNLDRLEKIIEEMYVVNIGVTAIGTGINTSEYYFDNIVPILAKICAYPLVQVDDDLFNTTKILMDL